ncbi:GDP-mannose 4,6-dehydratase [Fluoribacter gormanii]|uniref:GDP-mannose 4,6-dehydratase n=1 Tax=Fluoribacter gormanii TaxID=464 RepID=UPI002243DDFD|nr:GDP-mannose 4,6-dehydratase [Fluoribacter gormanii]MCW8470721.1 GDP-mannose 4,6-dehydratase [Fluoribacter gormanii]
MKKVIITGATGFTGYYLSLELIRAGMNVIGLCQRLPSHPIPQVSYFACDLLNKEELCKIVKEIEPEVVVHLAAISFIGQNNAETMYLTNIIGTRNLLESLSQLSKCPHNILLASSGNIYGNTDREFIDETVPAAPVNDYSVSKLSMEYMARLWMSELPITIVRPFNYTGVEQPSLFLVPKLVTHFSQRADFLELGNLNIVRDFSDVRDVVRAYRRLIEVGGVADEVVNICTGQGYSLQQILSILSKLTGHMPEIRVNPSFVRSHEIKHLVGCNQKLEQIIGPFAHFSLEETLNWMLEA